MPYDEDKYARRGDAAHNGIANNAQKAFFHEDEQEEEDQKYNVLPAGVYATVMGRHLIDPRTGSVQFDWPGVRLSFHVRGTTFVSIRIKTAGSVFGYRVYPVTELGDKLEQQTQKHQRSVDTSPEMLLGGGLFGGGKLVKEYALAVGLDPFLNYKIDIWKRDDPTGSVCIIEGLYVDKPHGMGVLQVDDDETNDNINNKIDTLSPLYAALQAQQQQSIKNPSKMKKKKALNLEFVGNSDTVGFGNLTTMSSKLYYTLCQASCISLFRRLYEGTDVTQSWPAFLSNALGNANYSVVAWSGVGAKYSMTMNESMTMLYPRVLASDAKTLVDLDDPYNTDKTDSSNSTNKNNNGLGPADAVLVYIGHNDKVRLANHRASNTKLSSGYEELLLLIRSYRPAPIPIIVIVPTLNAAVTGVASESKRLETCAIQHELWSHLVLYKLGGPAAGFYLVENSHMPAIEINSPRDFGMNLHWNVESQRKWAFGLVPQIRQVIDEAATTAAAMARQSHHHHGNHNHNSNNNHDTSDDDDDDNNDDISSKKASSVLALTTTANPIIAACALPFSCFAE